jgi:hypothetical protein
MSIDTPPETKGLWESFKTELHEIDKRVFSYGQDLFNDIVQLSGQERFIENTPNNTFLDPFLPQAPPMTRDQQLMAEGIPLTGNRPSDTEADAFASQPTELDIGVDSVTGEPTMDTIEAVAEPEAEVTSVDMREQSDVRGVRNNNPLNIEHGDNWDGLADDQLDTRFATFDDAEHGIRAAARILNTYREVHGVNTLSDIIHRWAPPNENDTEAYVKNVSEWANIPVNQEIVAGNNPTTKELLKAMSRQENGRDAANELSDDVYDRALELAFPE